MKIGVFPAGEFDKRPCLFKALECVFPVCFEGRTQGAWRDLDAAVVFSFAEDPDRPIWRALSCVTRMDRQRIEAPHDGRSALQQSESSIHVYGIGCITKKAL